MPRPRRSPKPAPGFLARLDKATLTALGVLLASAITTWVGSCRTNERVDAASSLSSSFASIDSDFATRLDGHDSLLLVLAREIRVLQQRRQRVLVADTIRAVVIVRPPKKPGFWARLWVPPDPPRR